MREIKFEYIYGNGKDFIKKSFTLDEISNGECYEFLSDMPMYKDYKLITYRQYTGLKDKNGKEIYEGDIVKYDDGDDWEVGREEVKFENGAFNVACYHPDYNEFIDEPRIIEIIGDIYQNPNLLINL